MTPSPLEMTWLPPSKPNANGSRAPIVAIAVIRIGRNLVELYEIASDSDDGDRDNRRPASIGIGL